MTIRIIGDTTSGLTKEQADKYGIDFIPQIIVFQDKSYRDDTEMNSQTFVKKLQESPVLPKTAAPPPVLYNPIYEDMMKKGQDGIIICPSSKMSGTVRSATTALKDFPDLKVRIIDSQSIASGIAMMLLEAKKLADNGASLDDIEERVRYMMAHEHFYGVVDTLEYLYKGGRIGGASKLVGELLQIKPILTLKDGEVQPFEKQRTKKRAMARMVELVKNECPKDPEKAMLTLSALDTSPDLPFLRKEFHDLLNISEIPYFNVPAGIMVHAGPTVVVIDYFTES